MIDNQTNNFQDSEISGTAQNFKDATINKLENNFQGSRISGPIQNLTIPIFQWMDFVTQPTPPRLSFVQLMFIMWFKLLFWLGFPTIVVLFFFFYIPGNLTSLIFSFSISLTYFLFILGCIFIGSKLWERIK